MKSANRWKLGITSVAVVVVSFAVIGSGPEADAHAHPATGVGSCALKNWNPAADPDDAKDLSEGQRPQTYKPDDYNCTGATFAAQGVEFTKFPRGVAPMGRTTRLTVPAGGGGRGVGGHCIGRVGSRN